MFDLTEGLGSVGNIAFSSGNPTDASTCSCGNSAWSPSSGHWARCRYASGCLIGYEIPDSLDPIPNDMPALFVPLQELENQVPGTWYINVLAVRPQFRGQGLGTKLLLLAEETAQGVGKRGMSVIVSDANLGAYRLYKRLGYDEKPRRLMVKDNWQNEGRSWILLTKNL